MLNNKKKTNKNYSLIFLLYHLHLCIPIVTVHMIIYIEAIRNLIYAESVMLSSMIPKKSRHIQSLNPKIIQCTFHGSDVMMGFQIFGVTFFVTRMYYGYIIRLWICFHVFNFVHIHICLWAYALDENIQLVISLFWVMYTYVYGTKKLYICQSVPRLKHFLRQQCFLHQKYFVYQCSNIQI